MFTKTNTHNIRVLTVFDQIGAFYPNVYTEFSDKNMHNKNAFQSKAYYSHDTEMTTVFSGQKIYFLLFDLYIE